MLLNGKFKLVDAEKFNDNFNYVTKWNIFYEGNDYVGINSSKDINFINRIYDWAKEAWQIYKSTNRTHIINPYT